jgi:hypothetical protein
MFVCDFVPASACVKLSVTSEPTCMEKRAELVVGVEDAHVGRHQAVDVGHYAVSPLRGKQSSP